MRLFDEVVYDQQIAGAATVYSDPEFDALLAVAEQLEVAAVCDATAGLSPTLRVDLEHSNDGQNWEPRTNVIAPSALSTGGVTTLRGADNGAVPPAAYARLRITLSGTTPTTHVVVTACSRDGRQTTDGGVWVADFTGLPPGAVAALPGSTRLTRASAATVQTSNCTVQTADLVTDVARAGDDGAHFGLVLEEARTNLLANGRAVASWPSGAGTATAGYAAGPDGAASGTRVVSLSGSSGKHDNPATIAGAHVGSAWLRHASSSGSSQLVIGQSGTTGLSVSLTTAWQRAVTAAFNDGQAFVGLYVADGRGGLFSGSTAGARDDVVDLCQIERASFATETIVTAGASASRAGERLYHPRGSSLTSSGRLGLEFALYPKGGSTAYSAALRLWTVDANNYAEISSTTRQVTVAIDGTSQTLGTAMAWAAGDLLEVWVAAGGGALVTNAQYRVNGGAAVDLGSSGSALGALSIAGALDLLCNGTSNQFSAWVRHVRAYASGRGPIWVA